MYVIHVLQIVFFSFLFFSLFLRQCPFPKEENYAIFVLKKETLYDRKEKRKSLMFNIISFGLPLTGRARLFSIFFRCI